MMIMATMLKRNLKFRWMDGICSVAEEYRISIPSLGSLYQTIDVCMQRDRQVSKAHT